MTEPRYHDQDDVVGFCADYRHPWGCQDDEPVAAFYYDGNTYRQELIQP